MQVSELQLSQDDQLATYCNAIVPCFQQIQESAARLAGLLLEAEVVGRCNPLDGESRGLGLAARDKAVSMLASIDPNKTDRHFHHHVELSLRHLCDAWSAFEDKREGLIGALDPLPSLKASWKEMQAASRILPGFETVDFRNSCCAVHRRLNAHEN